MTRSETQKASQPELAGAWLLAYNALGLVSQIGEAARHDHLTGMLNKEAWKQDLEERLQTEEPFGVVLMDMDGFKKVNDSFGHGRGDSLLEQFGRHMRKHFKRAGDALTHEQFIKNDHGAANLSRFGGDEFGMSFSIDVSGKRVETEEQSMEQTIDYARSVIGGFEAAQPADIRALGFGVSIGGALRKRGEQIDVSELLQAADMEMYADKRRRQAARSR